MWSTRPKTQALARFHSAHQEDNRVYNAALSRGPENGNPQFDSAKEVDDDVPHTHKAVGTARIRSPRHASPHGKVGKGASWTREQAANPRVLDSKGVRCFTPGTRPSVAGRLRKRHFSNSLRCAGPSVRIGDSATTVRLNQLSRAEALLATVRSKQVMPVKPPR